MTPTDQALRFRARTTITLIALTAFVAIAGIAPAARAGTYTVSGTCRLWSPYSADPNLIAVYPACPDLIARNVNGPYTTPAGAGGGWRFDPPAGTVVSSVDLQGSLQGLNGWQATTY